MGIQFFNTLTRKLEAFESIKPGVAEIYTCGPTIHDFAHIGNFRTYVFEDLLRRYLKYRGYQVKQVMNLTDVEDKIIRKSEALGINFLEFTKKYADAFFEDLNRLNIEPAEVYPRATDSVDKMAEMIRDLLARGIAYRSEDGSIYYDISKFADYGKLAHIEVDQLQSGHRCLQDEYEKDRAADFALWKAWDEGDGHVFWDQYPDLGKGRPGWHIECSAMSLIHLGEQFDIHCGGVDNIFPHHQNEIAQSEAFTGKRFVNYWLHSEHLNVESQKMSKSAGNFFTVRDLLDAGSNPSNKSYDPMAIRYALLSVHYRSRLNFKFDSLAQAESSLQRITDFVIRCGEESGEVNNPQVESLIEQSRNAFIKVMDDDLNIPQGLAVLFEFVSEIYRRLESGSIGKAAAQACCQFVFELDRVLGLQLEKRSASGDLEPELQALIDERAQARKDKNWKRSDEIRQELIAKGIVIEDTPQGLRWKRA
jgi:cysteinyl-tRNA synthetase